MLRCVCAYIHTVKALYGTILKRVSCVVIDFLSNLHTDDRRCFMSIHPFLCQNRRSGRIISGRLTVDNNDWHVTHFLTAIMFRGKWIVHKDPQRMHYEMQSWNLAAMNIREIAFGARDDVKLEYTRCIRRSIRKLWIISEFDRVEILSRHNTQNILYWNDLTLQRIVWARWISSMFW